MYFKDAEPMDTINKIQNIFQSIGISLNEIILEPIDGIFSVIINVSNTSISANGKGTSIEFAKASAYAELIERLQNFLHFRLCDIHALESKINYKFFKDDYYIKSEDDVNMIKKWTKLVFDNQVAKKLYDYFYSSDQPRSRLLSRFSCRFDESNVIYIPYTLLDYYYGSNGMASGNTFNEALVQAYSEVIERYIAKNIVLKSLIKYIYNITPVISNRFHDIDNYVKILNDYNIDVVFLDCSQQNIFPVIGVLYIDRISMRYFLNFGCHPDLHTAITRSLSEFLQGSNINELNDMTPFYSNFDDIDKNINISSIFHNGIGTFPLEIFFRKKAKILPAIWGKNYHENSECYWQVFLEKFRQIILLNFSQFEH
ncbi:YcaO-like family protein [Proteiniborus sp. MB09-C3]|uniref:YcaO-like family protein n=1 Tax=Proteiniborus sp. MB09-C3 TaxID=3050072 RepID=UPI00255713DF|nr:YcaO-like family protein [Proteiniborus sp. MB09-C3]WIV11348.1 YcaO-like family protein [Proteiniborus sp. MB09-C3]